jgi:hypothetical protein
VPGTSSLAVVCGRYTAVDDVRKDSDYSSTLHRPNIKRTVISDFLDKRNTALDRIRLYQDKSI